uniref:Uncharacterized protein n=1 Tax=Rhizophora mucronata TaxID=61149 RepID=A0A2P2LWT5_RHIMU
MASNLRWISAWEFFYSYLFSLFMLLRNYRAKCFLCLLYDLDSLLQLTITLRKEDDDPEKSQYDEYYYGGGLVEYVNWLNNDKVLVFSDEFCLLVVVPAAFIFCLSLVFNFCHLTYLLELFMVSFIHGELKSIVDGIKFLKMLHVFTYL